MGTARDLQARVVLALISASPAKPSDGRAAALVKEAQAIMAFITSNASPDEPLAAAPDRIAGRWRMNNGTPGASLLTRPENERQLGSGGVTWPASRPNGSSAG